ncbi:MAG: hypothetical protein RIT45_1008 [Pseudomonadota bacterium]
MNVVRLGLALLLATLVGACGSTPQGGYGYDSTLPDISSNFGNADGSGGGDDGRLGDGTAGQDAATADGAGGSDGAGASDGTSASDSGVGQSDGQGAGDTAPDSTPDATPDVTPDTTPDTTPDVTPDTTPDVTPDTAPDTSPDVPPSAQAPTVGELVITEFMANPAAVADTAGEWFEVCNVAGAARSLDGVHIADEKDSHAVQNGGALVIAPGACFVFGKSADLATNGGAPVGYAYGSAIPLNNSGVESITVSVGGPAPGGVAAAGATIIDTVKWGQAGDGFPSVSSGLSNQLALGATNASNNDIGTNWCTPLQPTYGLGDVGTPGQPNEQACK